MGGFTYGGQGAMLKTYWIRLPSGGVLSKGLVALEEIYDDIILKYATSGSINQEYLLKLIFIWP